MAGGGAPSSKTRSSPRFLPPCLRGSSHGNDLLDRGSPLRALALTTDAASGIALGRGLVAPQRLLAEFQHYSSGDVPSFRVDGKVVVSPQQMDAHRWRENVVPEDVGTAIFILVALADQGRYAQISEVLEALGFLPSRLIAERIAETEHGSYLVASGVPRGKPCSGRSPHQNGVAMWLPCCKVTLKMSRPAREVVHRARSWRWRIYVRLTCPSREGWGEMPSEFGFDVGIGWIAVA